MVWKIWPESQLPAIVRISLSKPGAGFTLVEVIIGMTLSLMVLAAVLGSYVFLARNFTRSLGIGSATDPNLEAQGRRALAYFSQDVDQGSGFSGILSSTEFTITVPGETGAKSITYYFNTTSGYVPVYGITAKPNSLTRIDQQTTTAITLHTNILEPPDAIAPRFDYYDASGNVYTAATLNAGNYLSGIKQLSMTFSSQVGSADKQTLSQVYVTSSPRSILRNKQFLP
jgi:hypothetical protein